MLSPYGAVVTWCYHPTVLSLYGAITLYGAVVIWCYIVSDFSFLRCCLTSTETVRIIRDGEFRTATSTFTQLLSSGGCLPRPFPLYALPVYFLPLSIPHITLIIDATAHVLIMQEQEVHDRPYFRYQRMQIRLGHEAQGCYVMQCDGLFKYWFCHGF